MNRIRIIFIIAFALVLLCGCVGTKGTAMEETVGVPSAWYYKDGAEYDKLFSLFNAYGGSVCMGISGPYSDKNKAIAVATEKCVQYLAFYKGLAMQVDFGSVVVSSNNKTSVEHNVIGGTVNEKISEVVNEFEIVDVQWLGGKIGAVVFARLPEMGRIKSITKVLGRTIPSIDGKYVAVATSEVSYSSFADAIEAATFRVAQTLIDLHKGTVSVSNSIVDLETTKYRGDAYSISGNRLEGFAVLAFEYNVSDGKVYALAVCNK